MREIRAISDETLAAWVNRTTQDFQLLTFTPGNLTIQIALLRLISIQQVSLADFARAKGGKTCFLVHLTIPSAVCEPQLITSPDDVLNSIQEFNNLRQSIPVLSWLRWDSKHVQDTALLHVQPSIEESVKSAIENISLANFYKWIGDASDEELLPFCGTFLGERAQQHNEFMWTQLKAVQPLCRKYIISLIATQSSCSWGKGLLDEEHIVVKW